MTFFPIPGVSVQMHHGHDLDLFSYHSKDDRVSELADAHLSKVAIEATVAFRVSASASDGSAQRCFEQGCLVRVIPFNVGHGLKRFGVSLGMKTERKHDTF